MKAQRTPLLVIENLNFNYAAGPAQPGPQGDNGRPLIQGFNLALAAGEIVSILGESGCGKTTLLNLIAGLLKPESGTISSKSNTEKENTIGYIFQNDALLPWRTIEENLFLAYELKRLKDKAEAREKQIHYLNLFHLPQEILLKYPSQLSGGMRQRVSIIQSLLFDPCILLLDEPFSALDFYTKLKLEEEFHDLVKRENRCALLVTHDIEEAIALSDRVILLARGKATKEYAISLELGTQAPGHLEEARGTTQFASYYKEIWSNLKSLICHEQI